MTHGSSLTRRLAACITLLAFVASFALPSSAQTVLHSSTTIHGGHTLVTPGDSLGGFMSGADKTKLDGMGSTSRGYADALSTTNIAALTGLATTVDGVALSVDSMRVCSFAQTTSTQDGCYFVHSGAWTRVPELSVGTAAHGSYIVVGGGTSNKGLYYVNSTSGSDVVGTNDLVAISVGGGGASGVTSFNSRTGAVVPATADYTADQVSALFGVDVAAVTTKALSAYTYNNGTAGVGATITGNVNQACDTIDGLTPSLTPAAGSYVHVLVNNGAAWSDNGLYDVTQIGDASHPCILTRDPRVDTPAEIRASQIHITQGVQRRGARYEYCNDPNLTIGTTALAWCRADARPTSNEYVTHNCEFELSASLAPGTEVPSCQLVSLTGGGTTTRAAGTATERGVAVLSGGATAGSYTILEGDTSGTTNNFVFDTTIRAQLKVKISGPSVLSTSGQRFVEFAGWASGSNIGSTVSVVGLEYTDAIGTTWAGQLCNGSACNPQTTGAPTVVVGTYVTADFIKYAGESSVHIAINGTELTGSPFTTDVPIGTALSPMVEIFDQVGTGTNATFKVDYLYERLDWPNGRI